jgi:hypothetical protein
MSQMKPYCFKCGAELDPDAIYCPECGRLQRSMVVRAVEPGGSVPAAAQPEQPYQYHPGQEAEPSQPAEHPPGQPPHVHDPYAGHQYADQGWYAGEAAAAGTQHDQHPDDGNQVHAQPAYPDPYAPGSGYEQPGYAPHEDPEPGYEPQYGHPQQPGHEQYPHPEPGHEQPGPHYGQLEQPGYEHEAQYEQPQTAYGEPEPAHGQHDPRYEQPQTAYGEPEPAYGQHEPPYEHPEPTYGQAEPTYGQAEPTYAHSEPGYGQAAPVYQPAEPVYRSSAPIPAGGGYPPQRPPAYVPEVNPYGPPPSEYAPPVAGPNRTRLHALLGAGLLGLLLIGFTIGQIMTRGSGSPSAPTNPPRTQGAAPPTSQPTAAPTAAPTPTAAQGTGNARFQKVSSDIPGSRCSTTQGCPITVTLKNTGDTGSGTVTVTLTDDAGNPVATFTGPIPSTDGGATVQVSGFATGDRLPTYLRSGGIVHITTVDVKNG